MKDSELVPGQVLVDSLLISKLKTIEYLLSLQY